MKKLFLVGALQLHHLLVVMLKAAQRSILKASESRSGSLASLFPLFVFGIDVQGRFLSFPIQYFQLQLLCDLKPRSEHGLCSFWSSCNKLHSFFCLHILSPEKEVSHPLLRWLENPSFYEECTV